MRISEDFYSVQGEGVSQGVPAYFIRLQGCNLICGGHNAELLKAGKSSWYCDTEPVWRQGKEVSNEELVERFTNAGQLEQILDGRTHLIWTGGEPTLPKSREGIQNFLDYMGQRFGGNNLYNELETNGTVKVDDSFYDDYIHQINCSPKLANSGMSKDKRINPYAMKQLAHRRESWFKFVVSKDDDILEIEKDYLQPFNIPSTRVILMPAVDKLKDLSETTRACYEMTKKYGYRTISRGQVLAYDRTTGV